MNLDEPRRFGKVDPRDALADVEAAAAQWREAQAYAGPPLDLDAVRAVIVSGMGGSGVIGDLVGALAADQLDLPILIHKSYGLPRWAGPGTLVIALSYSGDTEETLGAVTEAIDRGCMVLAISGGGALDRLARERGLGRVIVPGGGMPRHNLGKLAVPALVALGLDAGLQEAVAVQADLAAGCGRDVPMAANPAKRLASAIAQAGLTVACGGVGLPAVAAGRLKCMLNENAKLPAFAAVLPELCHNEVAGWEGESALTRATGIVWLRDPVGEHPRMARRVTLTDRVIAGSVAWTIQVTARGRSPLARVASLLLFVDLVSVYTALALERDPTPIVSIDRLKRELSSPATC
ncbi:MAG: bifunctional phosphoglucose/phosphomannose isomerase [Egibacteraceae bacterium]